MCFNFSYEAKAFLCMWAIYLWNSGKTSDNCFIFIKAFLCMWAIYLWNSGTTSDNCFIWRDLAKFNLRYVRLKFILFTYSEFYLFNSLWVYFIVLYHFVELPSSDVSLDSPKNSSKSSSPSVTSDKGTVILRINKLHWL